VSDTPAPDHLVIDPADVPPEGALGLLALGYRGIEAWRAARGTGWIAERQQEWEAMIQAAADAPEGAEPQAADADDRDAAA